MNQPTPAGQPERPALTPEARRVLAQIVTLIRDDPGPDRPPPAVAVVRPVKKAA